MTLIITMKDQPYAIEYYDVIDKELNANSIFFYFDSRLNQM